MKWAKADWQDRGLERSPRFVHVGANEPYPNAPRKACRAFATEQGFEILPAILQSMVPQDFSSECAQLKFMTADYAFLGNTTASVTALLKDCHKLGVTTQFMVNIWGFDETVMKEAGAAADGVVWVMGAVKWGDNVPGMYTVQEVSKMSDPGGEIYRPVHYIRNVCSMFYLKEAMEWADRNGGITGPNIRQAIYRHQDWVPAGLEGVCSPATWTTEDHRGVNRMLIYRSHVAGPTGAELAELIEKEILRLERIYITEIPRRPEWLGQ